MKPLPGPDAPEDRFARGLGAQMERWAKALDTDEELAGRWRQIGQRLGQEAAAGHVCIGLDDLAPALEPAIRPDALAQALLASPLVGDPHTSRHRPLVLDEEGRLYLGRYFDLESRLARRLVAALRAAPDPIAPDALSLVPRSTDGRSAIGAATGAPRSLHDAEQTDWQRVAIALAMRRRLTLISGGPGTGKTHTVVSLLAGLLAREPDLRIVLAAPTGKAAARLAQSIAERAGGLPETLRERLPRDATTVHRLLGVRGQGLAHGPEHLLNLDLLVLDEASMLDLELATRLLEAVPGHARIVWLGDKDQLAAVEAGAVFADLSMAGGWTVDGMAAVAAAAEEPRWVVDGTSPSGPLIDSVVVLQRTYRFDSRSNLGRLARQIRDGAVADALASLRDSDEPALRWMAPVEPGLPAAFWTAILEGFAPYFDAVSRPDANPSDAQQTFDRFRVLCALRLGPRGAEAINRAVSRWLVDRGPDHPGSMVPNTWYAGRPVMVRRNDALLRLFNGDIGWTLAGPDGRLSVHFPDPDGGWRALAPHRLPPCDTAFAMTVHQSQGSEFDTAAIVLPAQPGPAVTRELLYTAVTRSRRALLLCGSAAVVTQAIATPMQRRSGLIARLREALAASNRADPAGAPS